ncbi:EscT/YscT/HrcT family type III secretion system export apparatus protein [Hahella sp. CCB-MM4]|uniref:type III secretion system export apparatus subunit SctT n=1 Tax=Hahella sp. (strain CCB-MM4) TaxID=1926491 RepID=UPI000B9C72E9|nr:type III secretion system export apparatus subunit SctT [Hahella sp. CCB-MM4]OZG74403.1 EscT/YscT/HrcT family type III secretion system export apparatus protein [Hahella sp. CCB-MM4]
MATQAMYNEALNLVETTLLGTALCLPRIGAAFVVLPLLTQESVPALVRNSLFVSLAIMVYPIAFATIDPGSIPSYIWPFIVLKEIFLGACMGFLFGSIFWALSIAGGILDTQTGSNMANAMDPIQGHQTTPTGLWLSRFATWLFMVSGGFLIFLDVLLGSYKLWPIQEILLNLSLHSAMIFIQELEFIMTKALMIALPGMLVLALVDLSLGLINRFAQQINVLSLSMPIKFWLSSFILVISLGAIVEVVLKKLFANQELLDVMANLFS